MIHQADVFAHVKTSAGFDDQLPVILSYDETDPVTVSVTFDVPEGPTWLISRELLSEALDTNKVTGIGDVQVLNDGDTVLIFLATAIGRHAHTAAVKIDKVEVIEFLDETYEIVPREDEEAKINSGLDAYLADLLAVEGD